MAQCADFVLESYQIVRCCRSLVCKDGGLHMVSWLLPNLERFRQAPNYPNVSACLWALCSAHLLGELVPDSCWASYLCLCICSVTEPCPNLPSFLLESPRSVVVAGLPSLPPAILLPLCDYMNKVKCGKSFPLYLKKWQNTCEIYYLNHFCKFTLYSTC